MKRILVLVLFLALVLTSSMSVAADDYSSNIYESKYTTKYINNIDVGATYVKFDVDYTVDGGLFRYTVDYDGYSYAKWYSHSSSYTIPNEVELSQTIKVSGLGGLSISGTTPGISTTSNSITMNTSVQNSTYKYLYFDLTLSRMNIYWHYLTVSAMYDFGTVSFASSDTDDEVIW